jgi:hypothetical protein
MKPQRFIPLLLIFAPLALNSCTSSLLVKSSWNDNKIVVDGKDNDWGDTMFYIPSAQMTAGVRNDSSNMYVILKATNRQQAFQIMGLGLTVWFDPSGGTSEKFGIHFPIGHEDGGALMHRNAGDDQDNNQTQNLAFTDMMPNELEILGANENGPVRLTIADAKGIELQINRSPDGLIYELRVPLRKSPEHPYAIDAKGRSIGIGFESGKFEPSQRGGREGDGMQGEGGGMYPGGGEGGEMPGEPGGGMGGERRRRNSSDEGGPRQQLKQIDFWLKVRMANPTNQAD